MVPFTSCNAKGQSLLIIDREMHGPINSSSPWPDRDLFQSLRQPQRVRRVAIQLSSSSSRPVKKVFRSVAEPDAQFQYGKLIGLAAGRYILRSTISSAWIRPVRPMGNPCCLTVSTPFCSARTEPRVVPYFPARPRGHHRRKHQQPYRANDPVRRPRATASSSSRLRHA